MNKLRNRRGMTLLELLIAISLAAIVLTIIANLISATFKTYALGTTNGTLQLHARGAIDRISREMRQSLSVADSNGIYTTSANQIVLQLASINANETIIPLTYDYVIYRLDPSMPSKLQEIMVTDPASARRSDSRTILNNVDTITFSYYDTANTALASGFSGAKRIRFQIDTSQSKYGKNIPVSYSEQATLRNK